MSRTPYLDLNIPDKSSKGFVVTDVFEPNFTKLDQEAERVNLRKMSTEDNIEELKKANRYKVGDVVEVLGYYSVGDGGGHPRKACLEDDGSGILLANGLYANIVHSGEVNISWFGAKGDGISDDSDAFVKAIGFIEDDQTLNLENGIYYNSKANNDDHGYGDWIIDKKINLKTNGAILKRAKTLLVNKLESCVLRITKPVNIIGSLVVDGMETDIGFLLNQEGIPIPNKAKYARTQEVRIGVRIQNSSDFYGHIIAKNTTFGVVIENCERWKMDINSYNSGQAINNFYFGDPALGAGVKVNSCSNFELNISGDSNTNALCELEPNNSHGVVQCVGDNNSESLVTVYKCKNLIINAIGSYEGNFNTHSLCRIFESENIDVNLISTYSVKFLIRLNNNLNNYKTKNIYVKAKSEKVTERFVYAENFLGEGFENLDFDISGEFDGDNELFTLLGVNNVNVTGHMNRTNYNTKRGTFMSVTDSGGVHSDNIRINNSDILGSIQLTYNPHGATITFANCNTGGVSYIIQQLDTPYHATQMASLGILDSYHNYLTELHEYEKSQNVQSDSKIMNLNVLQPPVIPTEVEAYAKEYNLI